MVNASIGFASVGPITATSWLYRTGDGGETWQPVLANLNLSYVALDCISTLRCWALTPSENGPNPPSSLYESIDGGKTWATP
jgi:photosystem II stability/assembly factor-like uncharacterized protein